VTAASTRIVVTLIFVGALAGAMVEVSGRFDEIGQWRRGPAAVREWLIYGPYREVIVESAARVPPSASVLLYSDGDPALLPYYLYPRAFYQVDVEPEFNQVFMEPAPAAYPRRRPQSFSVDWVLRVRSEQGVLVPSLLEASRR